jgi:hypothetical protein
LLTRLRLQVGGKRKQAANNASGASDKTDAYKIVKMIMQRNYDPVGGLLVVP